MGQEIYNEGRVVGLSAWEIFAKHAEASGVPSSVIPNENQWLTAMIGAGASMILKIPAATTAGIHDFDLPLDSNLTSAGVIIANPFMGTCDWDDTNHWATKVTSYSPLILNNATDYPTSADVPQDDNYTAAVYKDCVSEFTKITDGIVFTKNATWVNSKIQEDNFTGDGDTVTFALSSKAVSLDTVTIDGAVPTTTYTLDTNVNTVTFGIAPSDESEIIITYTSLPTKDIDPNFNESSTTVRLYISSDITKDTAILLTGFQNKRILQGLSGFADSEGTGGSADITNNDWQNGGMLGPEIIPWASKIIFTVPSSAYNLMNCLERTIPSDAIYTAKQVGPEGKKITFRNVTSEVKTNSVIDFDSIVVTDYYNAHATEFSQTNPVVLTETVSEFTLGNNNNYNTLTAWYPGMTATKINSLSASDNSSIFPPALYATQIDSTGEKTLVPMDVAAPGTVKAFKGNDAGQVAAKYVDLMRDNFAMYYDNTNNTYTFVAYGKPASGTAKITYGDAPKASITAGDKTVGIISLTKSDGTTYYNTNGSSGTIHASDAAPKNIVWTDLLTALKDEKQVNLLGTKLTNLGNELATNNTIGVTNTVATVRGTKIKVNNIEISEDSNNAKLTSGKSVKVGTQYIEFADGKRLYIAGSAPSGAPEGSIGIGW